MKLVKAVIRPEKLGEVRGSLEEIGCCKGIMIYDIIGNGNQKGIAQVWRGERYQIDLLPKVALEIVVRDQDVPAVTQAIIKVCRSGGIGDGKIFVLPVEEVIRIRSGETGESAL
jgi:nitrogen regulatory protein P-II 1